MASAKMSKVKPFGLEPRYDEKRIQKEFHLFVMEVTDSDNMIQQLQPALRASKGTEKGHKLSIAVKTANMSDRSVELRASICHAMLCHLPATSTSLFLSLPLLSIRLHFIKSSLHHAGSASAREQEGRPINLCSALVSPSVLLR